MADSTSSRVLRTALFTLVPLAYLSILFWQPVGMAGMPNYSYALQWLCVGLMASVLLVSLLSWHTYRLLAVFGIAACFLWLCAFMLPVA